MGWGHAAAAGGGALLCVHAEHSSCPLTPPTPHHEHPWLWGHSCCPSPGAMGSPLRTRREKKENSRKHLEERKKIKAEGHGWSVWGGGVWGGVPH